MQTPVAKDDGDAPQDTVRRLEAEIARLRASRERLVVAAESERRVLERELHRGVQQQLVALAVVLQLAEEALGTDPAQTRRRLGDARSVVQQAVDDAARLAQRIHPPLLQAGGLAAAVRAAAASVGARATLELDSTAALPAEVAGTLYRCVLTALERTPPAARATVAVRATGGAVVFEISTHRSVAATIEELADRVDALGGELTTEPTTTGGLRLVGSIPLAR